MNVLVCGGRGFGLKDEKEKAFVETTLKKMLLHSPSAGSGYWPKYDKLTIIEGDASGVDKLAGEFAKKYKIALKVFPPDWEKYDKKAGVIRNTQMLKEGKPDLVIAFPGGTGTAHMIKIAEKAGVPVKEISWPES